jgi:hypothetical protein
VTPRRLRLRVLAGRFSVARLPPSAPIPPSSLGPGASFASVTRTGDELSVICEEHLAPNAEVSEGGWRILQLEGSWDLGEVGVLASIAGPLADGGVAILAVGTFSTDYLLVKEDAIDAAIRCLRDQGHEVVGTDAGPKSV